MGTDESGAVILKGDVEPGDRLDVEVISVEVAPVYVGGTLPPLLRGILHDLTEQLPIVLIEEGESLPHDLSFALTNDRLQVLSRDGSLLHQLPIGTGVEARVLALMLHEVALRQLSVLDNPLAPFEVKVSVEGERVQSPDGTLSDGVAVGRELKVKVTSDQSGYLTLLNLSPDGSVNLLTPNFSGQTFVQGGTEVMIPDANSEWAFRVEYPTGVGLLRALVTPTPLRFEESLSDTALPEATAFFSELEEQLGVYLEDSLVRVEYDPAANWSSALTLYHVFDPY